MKLSKVEGKDIPWLSEEEYQKAVGQFRFQVSKVFYAFGMYGMQAYIPGAVNEIVALAEDFGLRVRGVDKPISLELLRNGKRHIVTGRGEEA